MMHEKLLIAVFLMLGLNNDCLHTSNGPRLDTQEIKESMLLGKWVSDEDKKFVMVFTKSKVCNYYYDKKITQTFYFTLSKSCSFSDSTKAIASTLNAYVLMFSERRQKMKCYEILNLDGKTISLVWETNGRTDMFTKIK